MKWNEFKKKVEESEIKNDDEIFYIDTGNYPNTLTVSKSEDGVVITD